MTYAGKCRWTVYSFGPLVLNRVYAQLLCICPKQGVYFVIYPKQGPKTEGLSYAGLGFQTLSSSPIPKHGRHPYLLCKFQCIIQLHNIYIYTYIYRRNQPRAEAYHYQD